jgi:hypothetical protein
MLLLLCDLLGNQPDLVRASPFGNINQLGHILKGQYRIPLREDDVMHRFARLENVRQLRPKLAQGHGVWSVMRCRFAPIKTTIVSSSVCGRVFSLLGRVTSASTPSGRTRTLSCLRQLESRVEINAARKNYFTAATFASVKPQPVVCFYAAMKGLNRESQCVALQSRV